MSGSKIALLGAIAGFTIFLGLPIGRLRTPMPRVRALLNAAATGILLFLLWDVLAHAWEPVDGALGDHHYASAAGNGLVMGVCLGIGLVGLVYFDRWVARRSAARSAGAAGPGAAVAPAAAAGWRSKTGELALLIAVGIGLHNFAEGLAIGQSAASNEIALATVLVIGFALHNATEGFGIVAPLAGDIDAEGNTRRPSWGFLLAMALIGGGPTFLGTWVGHGFTSEAVSVAFLTLAAGSIIYVVCQLIGMASRANRMDLLALGVLIGLLAGFATDAIVTAGGV